MGAPMPKFNASWIKEVFIYFFNLLCYSLCVTLAANKKDGKHNNILSTRVMERRISYGF